MKPTDLLLEEKAVLEKEISKLIQAFEAKNGLCQMSISVDYDYVIFTGQGAKRVSVDVNIDLRL